MARIAVAGVGAIGAVVAALLHSTGKHELTLCTRRPLDGLTVATPDGTVLVEARNLTSPQTLEPAPEWIVVCTKTYDAAGAKAWMGALAGAETRVAVIQNGVEHRENFAPEFTVLPVIIDVPAERRADGSVLQRAMAVLRVEASADGRAFAELFAGSAALLEVTDDFVSAAWGKLCINCAGVVSALTLKPAGVLRDEALAPLTLGLVAECVAVGRAEGATLGDDTPAKVLAGARAGSPDGVNSLLADRMAGRATEIQARNGVIVRRGAKHGIPTPLNQAAVALFEAMSLREESASPG